MFSGVVVLLCLLLQVAAGVTNPVEAPSPHHSRSPRSYRPRQSRCPEAGIYSLWNAGQSGRRVSRSNTALGIDTNGGWLNDEYRLLPHAHDLYRIEAVDSREANARARSVRVLKKAAGQVVVSEGDGPGTLFRLRAARSDALGTKGMRCFKIIAEGTNLAWTVAGAEMAASRDGSDGRIKLAPLLASDERQTFCLGKGFPIPTTTIPSTTRQGETSTRTVMRQRVQRGTSGAFER